MNSALPKPAFPSYKPAVTDYPIAREDLFDAAFLDRLRSLAVRLRKRRALSRRGARSTPATGFTREFKDYQYGLP